jgi:NAD(P)H-flavin reductase
MPSNLETETPPLEAAAVTMLPRLFRVQRYLQETDDTFTLELAPLDEGAPLAFAPGQFNMLYVFGVGEVPISISGDPDKPAVLVHTTRAVGTVTKVMARLRRGDVIGVRGPYGTPWPVDQAEGHDVVIVAGGIGLAPLRPALYRLLARRDRFGKVVLLYGTRTPDDILYRKELERWRARFDVDVYVTVDRAIAPWRGSVGVVTHLIPKAPFDPLSSVALICGPEIMMRFSVYELEKRGVAADRIFVSLERNMKCGVGTCGHCQFGPMFVCREGPVFAYTRVRDWLAVREV